MPSMLTAVSSSTINRAQSALEYGPSDSTWLK